MDERSEKNAGILPVYKIVTDEIAMAILKNDIPEEMEEYLMTADPYLGEE